LDSCLSGRGPNRAGTAFRLTRRICRGGLGRIGRISAFYRARTNDQVRDATPHSGARIGAVEPRGQSRSERPNPGGSASPSGRFGSHPFERPGRTVTRRPSYICDLDCRGSGIRTNKAPGSALGALQSVVAVELRSPCPRRPALPASSPSPACRRRLPRSSGTAHRSRLHFAARSGSPWRRRSRRL
jgi:hypothetical protein